MNINRIQSFNQQKSFKAGKVRVFSDFDRTFLPASHKQFVSTDKLITLSSVFCAFRNFKDFLNKTRKDLEFTITTGRTYGEFLTMVEAAKKHREMYLLFKEASEILNEQVQDNVYFGMPLPDTLIVKNGSDEYIKNGTDEDFYEKGLYPFKYELTNKKKEEDIRKITGWDGPKVKKIINDAFKSRGFRIFEGDSEHSKNDYDTKSLYTDGKLYYEESRPDEWQVGFRKDGNLKMYIIHPRDFENTDLRQNKYQEIKNEIETKLKAENIKFKLTDENKSDGRIAYSYEPDLQEIGEEHLTKFYDTSKALKEAEKNNDLVIVAGDGSNDFEMLNPAYYLKNYLTDEIYNRHGKENLLNALNNPDSIIEILNKDSELAETFMKMPFRGVVVRQEDGSNDLSILESFASGKYQKITVVNQGELESGIKQAIKAYSEQNSKYKDVLSSDLKEVIKEEPPKSPQKEEGDDGGQNGDGNSGGNGGGDDGKSESNAWKYILGVIGAVGLGGGIYAWNKNRKKENM